MLPEELVDAKRYIQRLDNDCKRIFKERNRLVEQLDDLYYLRHHKGRTRKPSETFVTVNKATNIVDLSVGILTSNPMRIRAQRLSQTEQDEKESTQVEKFLQGCIYINDERHQTDTEATTTFDQVRSGWGVVRTFWDPFNEGQVTSNRFGEPYKIYDELPIYMDVVPIEHCYWEEGGVRRYRYFIYSCKRTVQDIEDEWGPWTDRYTTTEEKEAEVDYIDYWGWTQIEVEATDADGNPIMEPIPPSELMGQLPMPPGMEGFNEAPLEEPLEESLEEPLEGPPEVSEEAFPEGALLELPPLERPVMKTVWAVENAIIADGEWIKEPTVMEGYDDIPYTVIPGRLTTAKEAEHKALSILFPVIEPIKDLESQLSRQRRVMDLFAYMPPIFKRANVSREVPTIDSSLGNLVVLEEGEEFGFPQWPGSPPDITRSIDRTERQIQEGSFPNVAYGEEGGSSGYGVSLLTESGRTRLYQFQRNLERGWAVVFRKILSLASNFAPDDYLQVYGRLHGDPYTLSITGRQMRGFRVDVEIRPNFPRDETERVVRAQMVKGQNMLSLRTIWEKYLGIDNPDEEQKRILVEMAMQNPELIRAMIQEALGEWSGQQLPQEQPEQRAPETVEQNMTEQAMAGQLPSEPLPGAMPPAAVMPQEMAGVMPPQAVGLPPPGQQMDPAILELLNLMQRGGM